MIIGYNFANSDLVHWYHRFLTTINNVPNEQIFSCCISMEYAYAIEPVPISGIVGLPVINGLSKEIY